MYTKSDTLTSLNNKRRPQRTDKYPFATQWLDSCYQETLLPDKPWEKVRDKITVQFAEKLKRQQDYPERFEMILNLVGTEFKKTYFPDVEYKPFLLEPPNMHKEQRDKLKAEASAWLSSQVYKAAKEVDCSRVLPGMEPAENVCPEMLVFLQNTYNTFQTGLDRQLLQLEQNVLRSKDEEEQEKSKKEKERRNIERVEVRAYGTDGLSSTTSSATIRKRLSTAGFDVKIGKMPGEAPTFTTPQTEAVGESVKAVLMRDPRRFIDIARRLHGRQLPMSLRAYMWLDILFKTDRERLPESNVERAVRERFGRAVSKGVVELQVKRATTSTINGLIEKAVKEVYNQTLSMQGYNNQYHVKDTCRALNVLYTYDRSYEPYLIHWLFPLQVAFKEQSDAGEHVYELAMYLNLLNEHCFPSWPQIFAMAERTMETLEVVDEELYTHLKIVAQKDIAFNPKEFMVYLLHVEKEQASSSDTERKRKVTEAMNSGLLADPVVFLRKWIGEGFVSILDTGAVMFIWDQCFLQMWQGPAMEHMCLILLLLLRHKFMAVTDYKSMKEVFFNAPCKLYTADIQRAWVFVERGGDPADVPYMSRQRPVTPPPSPPPTPEHVHEPDVLPPIHLKNIKIKLHLTEQSKTKNPWLSQLDPGRLKVLCSVYYGSVKLTSKLSRTAANLATSEQKPDGGSILNLNLDEECYDFEDIDIGRYDAERELGAYPYAVLRVDYILFTDIQRENSSSPSARQPVNLGWAKVPLFRKQGVLSQPENQPQNQPDATRELENGNTKGSKKNVAPKKATGKQAKKDKAKQTKEDDKEPVAPESVKEETAEPKKDDSELPWVASIGEKVYSLYPGTLTDITGRVSPPAAEPSDDDMIATGSEINVLVFEPHVDAEDKKETPTPEPKPEPEPEPETVRDDSTPISEHWVKFDEEAAKDDVKGVDVNQTFDIYIDYARFLPDNASICKVTGRLLRTGEVENIPDLAAYPEIQSSPRNPIFHYCFTVNQLKKKMDPNALLLLRLYTVQSDTSELVVIGSCLLSLYDSESKLRVGGYQLPLHPAMPDLKKGMEAIVETDLDSSTRIPAVSLCFRVLPSGAGFVSAPVYSNGYYRSEKCKPTKSEWRIFEAFTTDTDHPDDFIQMTKKLKSKEKDDSETNANTTNAYLKRRLDQKRHLPLLTPAHHIYISHCVKYRCRIGLKIHIKQAFGLQETEHAYIYAEIIQKPKADAAAKQLNVRTSKATIKSSPEDHRIVVSKLDPTSSMKSPKYQDEPVTIHPNFDERAYLLVKVFLVNGVYKPWRDNSLQGSVHPRKGAGQLSLDKDVAKCWAAVPLFDWEATASGEHVVPLFKGDMPATVKEQLQSQAVDYVLAHTTWTRENKFDSSGLLIQLKDCHFIENECPYDENKRFFGLLDAVGDRTKYVQTLNDQSGKKVSDVLSQMIKSKDAAVLKKEREFMDKAMIEALDALLKAETAS
ncbi:uncharacterized protein LOC141899489 [Tubulanus polymorphus]|uniref:uncharacterized protein LOC141899489 n=1 Tax=Tubulanus polymorphus TaxID=672921 RepID=UPI003DA567F0